MREYLYFFDLHFCICLQHFFEALSQSLLQEVLTSSVVCIKLTINLNAQFLTLFNAHEDNLSELATNRLFSSHLRYLCMSTSRDA